MLLCELFEPLAERAMPTNPAFWNWFRGSKVVDENGDPLVVYHGTRSTQDITSFTADNDSPTTMGKSHGYYFTGNTQVASDYADDYDSGQVLPVYLRMVNPLRLPRYINREDLAQILGDEILVPRDYSPTYGSWGLPDRAQSYYFFKDVWGERLIPLVKRAGYDGLIFPETHLNVKGDLTYVVFDPNQIKSVFNAGAFDPDSDHISETATPQDDRP